MSSGRQSSARPSGADARLSYKFQRLRERLRAAVTSGELSGKLPGERQLARRFSVNAKTLSKALTDLAAEGLLDRSIGRGTFVRGAEPRPENQGRWLFIVEPENGFSWMRAALAEINPLLDVITSAATIRPSDLGATKCAIDMASDTPPEVIRGLMLRGIAVVSVNKHPATYSTHNVVVDRPLGASNLTRELVFQGHRRLLVVEGSRGQTPIGDAVREVARRYDDHAFVETATAESLGAAVANGFTAVVAGCRYTGEAVMREVRRLALEVPAQLSIAAVGAGEEQFPCSGYYVSIREFAQNVGHMLRHGLPHRPTTFWLAGRYHDLLTVGPPPAMAGAPDTRASTEIRSFRPHD